jgi:hypothetical protein
MPAFISHKSEDIAIYSAVCLALDGAGVQRWDVNNMSRGESLADQLRDAIRKCEVCIFIATSRSILSSWCLAELGAFWGAGKRVLLFISDPDLTDSVLPPQFKGDLKVNTAHELIDAAKIAISNSNSASEGAGKDLAIDFFETSGNYGTEKNWQKLLNDTDMRFDIMGVNLLQWRKTPGFRETVLKKAKNGCKARILIMDEENPVLRTLLYDHRSIDDVIKDIKESFLFYSELASVNSNIGVRKIVKGIPHFFLTQTDKHAVIIQYLSSAVWGSGPTWRCISGSQLYNAADLEFDYLWNTGTRPTATAQSKLPPLA